MWDVEYHPKVGKEIEALDSHTKPGIRRVIEQLREDPLLGKLLTGRLKGYRSRRVGDYRIVYEMVEEPAKRIFILHVGLRAGAYGKSRRRKG